MFKSEVKMIDAKVFIYVNPSFVPFFQDEDFITFLKSKIKFNTDDNLVLHNMDVLSVLEDEISDNMDLIEGNLFKPEFFNGLCLSQLSNVKKSRKCVHVNVGVSALGYDFELWNELLNSPSLKSVFMYVDLSYKDYCKFKYKDRDTLEDFDAQNDAIEFMVDSLNEYIPHEYRVN
jgi:hypothetical protein